MIASISVQLCTPIIHFALIALIVLVVRRRVLVRLPMSLSMSLPMSLSMSLPMSLCTGEPRALDIGVL